MKITEILIEAEDPKNQDPANLSPEDDIEQDIDKIENDLDDIEGEEEEDKDLEKFKTYGSDLGHGLYVLTMWDYDQNFEDVGPSIEIKNYLKSIPKNSALDYYNTISTSDVADDKLIAVVFLNSNNNKIFCFYSGKDSLGFDPDSIQTLVKNKIIDQDQKSTLENILSLGRKYHDAVVAYDWKTGYEATNDKIYQTLNALVNKLKLQPTPDAPNKIKFKDKNSEKSFQTQMSNYDAEIEKALQYLEKNPFGRSKQ